MRESGEIRYLLQLIEGKHGFEDVFHTDGELRAEGPKVVGIVAPDTRPK
jgi:hypothetical protein